MYTVYTATIQWTSKGCKVEIGHVRPRDALSADAPTTTPSLPRLVLRLRRPSSPRAPLTTSRKLPLLLVDATNARHLDNCQPTSRASRSTPRHLACSGPYHHRRHILLCIETFRSCSYVPLSPFNSSLLSPSFTSPSVIVHRRTSLSPAYTHTHTHSLSLSLSLGPHSPARSVLVYNLSAFGQEGMVESQTAGFPSFRSRARRFKFPVNALTNSQPCHWSPPQTVSPRLADRADPFRIPTHKRSPAVVRLTTANPLPLLIPSHVLGFRDASWFYL